MPISDLSLNMFIWFYTSNIMRIYLALLYRYSTRILVLVLLFLIYVHTDLRGKMHKYRWTHSPAIISNDLRPAPSLLQLHTKLDRFF